MPAKSSVALKLRTMLGGGSTFVSSVMIAMWSSDPVADAGAVKRLPIIYYECGESCWRWRTLIYERMVGCSR
jgi:hypothetical protein